MRIDILTEEQKIQILNECINTKKLYGTIAKEYNVSIEEVYQIINGYCRENNYKSFVRAIRGFEKEDGKVVRIIGNEEIVIKVNNRKSDIDSRRKKGMIKTLQNVESIEEWFNKNGRLPRSQIRRR